MEVKIDRDEYIPTDQQKSMQQQPGQQQPQIVNAPTMSAEGGQGGTVNLPPPPPQSQVHGQQQPNMDPHHQQQPLPGHTQPLPGQHQQPVMSQQPDYQQGAGAHNGQSQVPPGAAPPSTNTTSAHAPAAAGTAAGGTGIASAMATHHGTAGGPTSANAPVPPSTNVPQKVVGTHEVPSLTPFQPPLGPQPTNKQFYSPTTTILAMKEKVFSIGQDFTVTTAEGLELLKVKGKIFSAHSKKKFVDAATENELFTLSNKLVSMQKSFHGEAPTGHNFEIKGHFKLMGSKSSVHFVNAADGREVELIVKGDWFDRHAEILDAFSQSRVAIIDRKFFNAREFFGDKQTYFVAVAPNVDLSLVSAVCVALDEKEND